MNKDIAEWCKACLECQRNKVHRHTKFSRWPEAFPMVDQTAATIAETLFAGWISRFGVPDCISTDQGRAFESDLCHALMKFFGTEKNRTTAYNPASNGQVERFLRQLKQAIRCQATERWVEVLPSVLLGIRSCFKEDLGASSAELVYGTTLRLPDVSLHCFGLEWILQYLGVWNIDEDGHYVKSCQIQVTDTDLVLHQRGKPPIVWPLQSLRRYGFDTELFSFECGRHCPTGPGIYAFKCKEAEALFNALQECLLVPRSDSEVVNGDDTEPHSSLLDDPFLKPSSTLEHESSRAMPSAPVPTPSLPATPKRRKFWKWKLAEYLNEGSIVGLPPLGSFNSGKKFLPRCCMIGTCINASKQHYMNNKVLRKTTCGSCRTCSLNMCVVQTNASTMTYSDRAKQADYGNVLDHGGHPRNCVHCCCDFKPTQKVSCSADDCPLHFNNCVDQITNYARLEKNNRMLGEKSTLRKEKLYQMQQPYSHVYTHIPTSVPKWPKTKSMSWRSLPQCGTHKATPKRSASHFYTEEKGKENVATPDSEDPKTGYLKLDSTLLGDTEDGSLSVVSSLSSKEGSDPEMYAKIDFEKTDELAEEAEQEALLHLASTHS
ncbi:hypothetical protein JTE90_014604 [Oedothorax gibbosus]|uniref:Integrase catalytic domain-containing protein n=1 Tax=Oedothorax gibbosus TaxID=931172 RepID=A0AAV6V810_9ARAC|nr:hypothetical protein JTE90_014604 [Oedothorax gibbosus]